MSGFSHQKRKTFTVHKDLNFLTIMHDILPITADKWRRVVEEHNSSEPPPGEHEYNQNSESIQKQWRNLYSKCAPTGDPNCPENVGLAKKVKVVITQKLEAYTGAILFFLDCLQWNLFLLDVFYFIFSLFYHSKQQ